MTIDISLDKRKIRKRGFPVALYIYLNENNKQKKSLKYYSFEKDWDDKRSEPKPSHPEYASLSELVYSINQRKRNIVHQNFHTAEQVARHLLGESESIYEFWEEWIREWRKKKSGNADFYEANLKQWKNFKDPLHYSEINYNLIVRFKQFKSEISPGGRNTYIKAIRAVYNEAVRRGYYTNQTFSNPFHKVMEKTPPTKDKYLSMEEMRVLYRNPSEHKFYRVFMFCFYLGGIDFVDARSLKKAHTRDGRVKFVRFKGHTNEVIHNRVFPEAEAIINSFGEEEYLTDLHRFVAKPYRQKYVNWMREYAESLGIKSYIDSKTPRYTFINLGKQLFLNRDVIMEITGHSRSDVHSIYEGGFTDEVQDGVHRKIIDAVQVPEEDPNPGEK